VLQLICRSGELLADLYAGTFKIDDIHDPGGTLINKVAVTPFSESHKIGTGRYAILSGATTTWNVGTHRAVCQYQMVEGGPTYTQSIEFEILDASDWATGALYTGYATTRRLIADAFVGASFGRPKLHRHIDRVSRLIESWTSRFFGPKYLVVYLDGPIGPNLHFEEAIIALEQIQAVYKIRSGTGVLEEQTYDYDPSMFQVYNRHLDGLLSPDDRKDPRVVRLDGDFWPDATSCLKVAGVFGFTDPTLDPHGGRVLIGKEPDDLVTVLGSLVQRAIQDPSMSNLSIQRPGTIRSMRTRDQAVLFGTTGGGSSSSSSSSSGELTGDPVLDQILWRFSPPIGARYLGGVYEEPSSGEEFSR
jgi:hypothetical protein